jgi:hypothetical protein
MNNFNEQNMSNPEYKLSRLYKALADVTANDGADHHQARNLLHAIRVVEERVAKLKYDSARITYEASQNARRDAAEARTL